MYIDGEGEVVVDQTLNIKDGRFFAYIKVFRVAKTKKFPDGLKVRCTLVDQENEVPILILDNHEPFGYHMHTRLPDDPEYRASIDIANYSEAIELFLNEVERLVNYES